MLSKNKKNFLNILGLYQKNHNLSILISLFIFLVYGITWYLSDLIRFSPDSWTIFELSKSIFTNNFYEFTTIKSNFSEIKGVSFPFGFPILLALIGEVIGYFPSNAIFLNILICVVSSILILNFTKEFKFPIKFQLLASLSLILNPIYIDEVLSGRTIPLAILLVLLAEYFLKLSPILYGLFLGLSALVRFDFLAISVLFIFGSYFYKKTFSKKIIIFKAFLGFFLGVSPWVVYSYINFEKLWISDHSWLVFSAINKHFMDFPPQSDLTIFNSPLKWFLKVNLNILRQLREFINALLKNPIPLFLQLLVIKYFKILPKIDKKKFFISYFLLFISTSSYILTGVLAQRYFIFILFSITLLSLWNISIISSYKDIFKEINKYIILSLSLSLVLAFGKLSHTILTSKLKIDHTQIENKLISDLDTCHKYHPEKTYFFLREGEYYSKGVNPFKYGALTSNKTATEPWNFDQMTLDEKNIYFKKIQPYKIIPENLNFNLQSCRE